MHCVQDSGEGHHLIGPIVPVDNPVSQTVHLAKHFHLSFREAIDPIDIGAIIARWDVVVTQVHRD